jgi:hypothetical protein
MIMANDYFRYRSLKNKLRDLSCRFLSYHTNRDTLLTSKEYKKHWGIIDIDKKIRYLDSNIKREVEIEDEVKTERD